MDKNSLLEPSKSFLAPLFRRVTDTIAIFSAKIEFLLPDKSNAAYAKSFLNLITHITAIFVLR